MNARSQFLFAASASVLVIAAVIAGLVVNGSPNTVRAQKLDAQRIADMERISSSVSGYWKERNSLPEALRDLQKADPYIRMSDVETGSAYEYRKTGPMSYELCARFDAAADGSDNNTLVVGFSSEDAEGLARMGDNFWAHPAGRHCFALSF